MTMIIGMTLFTNGVFVILSELFSNLDDMSLIVNFVSTSIVLVCILKCILIDLKFNK